MEKHSFIQLIDKYISGTASESERQLVEEYLKRMEAEGDTSLSEVEEPRLKQAMWQQIQQRTGKRPAKVIQGSWYKAKIVRLTAAVAAACAIIMVFIWRPWESSLGDGNFQTVTVAQGNPIQKV